MMEEKTGRLPSPPQTNQKFICVWNNSYRIHSGCWQKTLGISKKASQSPQNETGQKIRIKKETKDFRTRTCAIGEGVCEGGNVSTHSETFSQAVWEELWNLRGEGAGKAKWREFPTETVPDSTPQARSGLHAHSSERRLSA